MESITQTNKIELKKQNGFKLKHFFIVLTILILSFSISFFVGKINSTPSEANTKIGPMFESPEFTVNLANTNGRRFLKTQFSLEVDNKRTLKELNRKLPLIKDRVISILSIQTIDDLDTNQGREKIKEQLKEKINSSLDNGSIKNIYFNNFVWQ